ncbi:MAG: C4-type zinc ribbon domain-containing protein [Candidatus Krumholzibacteria bacterium]
MTETQRDLGVLVAVAKLDVRLNGCRLELGLLPDKIARLRRTLEDIVSAEASAEERLKSGVHERRSLEQQVEDNAERIKKYKTQLMEVKTNKEYTAMLHEISHVESDTDAKEERLLILMDELDQLTESNEKDGQETSRRKKELSAESEQLEERVRALNETIEKLEAEKPGVLSGLNPRIKRQYERVLAKMNDFAVANVEDDVCQGCFARIPPQTSVEVRQNARIITCEACGRILVHYDA